MKTSLIGKTFGRLLVLFQAANIGKDRAWECVCECGNKKIVKTTHLKSGTVRSCGCLQKETMKHKNGNQFKLPAGEASLNAIIFNYKYTAKKRNLAWGLSKEQCIELFKSNCNMCNMGPSNEFLHKNSNGSYMYNGIDRIDNTEGYTVDNVQTLCKRCNVAKNDMTNEEFLDWVLRVVENNYDKIKR